MKDKGGVEAWPMPTKGICILLGGAMRRILAAIVLAGASVHANGEGLLDVYRIAKGNDPIINAARHAYEAAREKIPQARAGLLPVLSLSANDGRTNASSKFSNAPQVDRDVHAWTWSLQLTQPLIRMQNLYVYNESEWLIEQAGAQYTQAEQDLILRVTQAYFEVLIAQESIDVAAAQLKAAGEQLALAQRGFETGTKAITDTHEAKSRFDLARSQHIEALNELEIKYAELEKLIGVAPRDMAALHAAVVVPRPQPDDVNAWIERARENNPAVLAPKAAFNAAEAGVSKSRAEYMPTLDAVASYGSNFSSGNTGLPSDFETRTRSRQYGVQLNMPLYAGGLTSSRVSEAIASRNRVADELEAARRQSGAEARQTYSAIVNGLAQIEALESAVESSKSAVNGNKVGYKLGIHANIDVLNAEQQLHAAQRDLVRARYMTLFQGLKLKAAAGVLAESDLIEVNGLLTYLR